MMQRAMRNRWTVLAVVGALQILSGAAWANPKLTLDIPRHKPCNLFLLPKDEPRLEGVIKCSDPGSGEARVTVVDYFGRTALEQTVPLTLEANKAMRLPLDFTALPRGYYEVTVQAAAKNAAGEEAQASRKACFGIADRIERTAAQVREGNYRFGMKMSYLGQAWWAGNAEWDEREVLGAVCKLGLQWTRVHLQQTSHLATIDLMTDFPMNCITKIERFPKEFYDEERYGPLKEWEEKFGKGQWNLKTLPRKEPYQAWLREWLAKVPADQQVFEIWNEPWDKMSAEEFATISKWIVEVVKETRPDAILGPNLRGDMSKYEYDARVIDAGGMEGMDMVALHPYGAAEGRDWIRAYRNWLREKLGRDIKLYVTEYGSYSTPEGPSHRTERDQAQRVVRQSLSLYAEGVQAFTPHCLGQREENPTYHEHWYGFVRLNHEIKPALIAHAVSARMVDGSNYLGDLWFGPGVGAMLYERNGVHTLALWTREGEKQIELEPGVGEVTLVDMVGAEQKVAVQDGKLPVTVGMDMTYVVGLSPALTKLATTELNPDRWPKPEKEPRVTRTMKKIQPAPVIDGKLDEWKGMSQVAMLNPKVHGDDASGVTSLAWDEEFLYIAVEMRDNEIYNQMSRAKLYRHDSIELFTSTEARENNPGYGPNDRQFFITPTSGEGIPIFGMLIDREGGVLGDVEGGKFFAGKGENGGWVAEVALPWKVLSDFKAVPGAKMALEIRVNDADTAHERWKIDPVDLETVIRPEDPTKWSYLVLEE